MKLEILSFEWDVFKSDDVVSVNVMTKNGEVTILENHMPIITSINPGVLFIQYKEKDTGKILQTEFAVWRGVLEVGHNSSKILIDMLVSSENLDAEKAEKARQEAITLMEKYKNSKDKVDMEKFIEAEDMLFKSIAQLKLSNIK